MFDLAVSDGFSNTRPLTEVLLFYTHIIVSIKGPRIERGCFLQTSDTSHQFLQFLRNLKCIFHFSLPEITTKD
jgi:hypothetical protein